MYIQSGLKSFLASLGLALLVLEACSPFPENPSKPFLTGTFDTVVNKKGLIGPGDSLIWWHSLANASGTGNLEWFLRPSPSTDYTYEGPDPAIPTLRMFSVNASYQNQQPVGFRLPQFYAPGEYLHLLVFRPSDGSSSDTLKKKVFQYHPAYPELVLDTPGNGLLGSHILTRNRFKVQFRGFGVDVSQFRFEWFDSTKTNSLSPVVEIPITSEAERRFNDSLDFPNRTGKQFFLKSTLKNSANRSITWWIPMTRKLN